MQTSFHKERIGMPFWQAFHPVETRQEGIPKAFVAFQVKAHGALLPDRSKAMMISSPGLRPGIERLTAKPLE